MRHSSRQKERAPRQEPGTGGYFLSDAELAARAAAAPAISAGILPEKPVAATPAELLALQQEYAALSNLEYAIATRQQRWRWVWGLGLMVILAAAVGLLAVSWLQPTLTPATANRPASSGVTSEELPPPATTTINPASVASSAARSAATMAPQAQPLPAVVTTATNGANAEPTGAPRVLTGPPNSKKAERRQPNQAAVKREAAGDANPAAPCSAAAQAMALCDIKGR